MRRIGPKFVPRYRAKVVRRLRFDSLEDRQLLAGLNVFVFDDANSSANDEPNEVGLAERIVFLDQDRDGELDPTETWVKTDRDGRARFDDLLAGDYFPTLFGKNSSLTQTTSVQNAPQGQLHPILSPVEALSWNSEKEIWISTESSIELVELPTNSIVQSIRFNERVIHVAIDPQNVSGLAVLESNDGIQRLTKFDLQSADWKSVDIDATSSVQDVFATASGLYAKIRSSNGLDSLARFDATNNRLIQVSNSSLPSDAAVHSTRFNDRLLVVSSAKTRLTSFELRSNELISLSTRDFNVPIQVNSLDQAGKFASISKSNQVTVIDLEQGLLDAFTVGTGSKTVIFDSLRSSLLVQAPSEQQLITYKIGTWQELQRSKLEHSNSIGNAILSPNRERLASISSNGLYSLDLTLAKKDPIRFEKDTDFKSIVFGQRKHGTNSKPTINSSSSMDLLEDGSISFGIHDNLLGVRDSDRDLIGLFVVEAPRSGRLNWSFTQGGNYIPNRNFEGSDRILVRAFDGLSWSDPAIVQFKVAAVDDLPTGVEFNVTNFSEAAQAGESLGVVTVLDPDRDASYRVTVGDSRLLVVDGVLRVAEGAKFDFESESSITFEIVATDLKNPGVSVEKTITVDIQDANDAPSSLTLDPISVEENEIGVPVGSLVIVDQDRNEEFRWIVTDPRFVVREGNLYLAAGVSIDFEEESSIALTVTAYDRAGSKLSATVIVPIQDRNDPPHGIVIDSNQVLEDTPGFEVGFLSVIDQDAGELYNFSVSDPRFMVEGSQLKLRPAVSIPSSAVSTLSVSVTATSRLDGGLVTDTLQLVLVKKPAPWQNPNDPMDVDGDGYITPLDPLIIINELNRGGIRVLGDPPFGDGEPGHRIDVNGDGRVTPIDVIIIINHLNQHGRSSALRNDPNASKIAGEGEGLASPITHAQVADASLAFYLAEQLNSERSGPIPEQSGPIRGQKRFR